MPDQQEGRVVVAGASGLIGTELVRSLRADGIPVTTLVRHPAQSDTEIQWLKDSAPLHPDVIAGARAVVGLNGASIGRLPWTAQYRGKLLWSRITPTRTLARAVRELGQDAPALISASASGYYGPFPRGTVDESGPQGDGFLAQLCADWEQSATRAGEHARIVTLRTAPVVHPEGVLRPLIQLTRLGLSGPLSRGTQVWPWISLIDEVRAIRHAIDSNLVGPVNLVSPQRTTANDLGFALARRMNKPFVVRAPEVALRMILGADAADALLLTDASVLPHALEASGFSFALADVDDAIAAVVPAGESPILSVSCP